jgi:CheY-like chemotaxis protein
MTSKIRVLCVDDEHPIRTLLQGQLEQEGYDADIAADGDIAITKLDASPFDVVLLDIRMPKVGGIEVLKHIRDRGMKDGIGAARGERLPHEAVRHRGPVQRHQARQRDLTGSPRPEGGVVFLRREAYTGSKAKSRAINCLRTPPGPEGSNGRMSCLCDTG